MRANDLLIVIDMQNIYMPGQPWGCQSMERTERNVLSVLRSPQAPQAVFTRFLAAEHPHGVWRDYNEQNAAINESAWYNALLPSMAAAAQGRALYTKSTYSALSVPELYAQAQQAGRVVVSGVVAECCVLSTVFALIDAGAYVVYLTDAVSGIDHQTENAVTEVLAGLSPLHLTFMKTEEYLHE